MGVLVGTILVAIDNGLTTTHCRDSLLCLAVKALMLRDVIHLIGSKVILPPCKSEDSAGRLLGGLNAETSKAHTDGRPSGNIIDRVVFSKNDRRSKKQRGSDSDC